ncbi:MAG: ROK family protein [Verrucomicrobia bacterium]|jgi:predicted NBD/HSP70 family sugar kinase|nr:ROK family protein [Verrucomicrobiota bacterium]
MKAPLDPQFQPAVLANREHRRNACEPLVLGLERENGLISRYDTVVNSAAPDALRYTERLVKCLLWSRGGWKLHIGGPKAIGEFIRKTYAARGARKFDCDLMGKAYGKTFQVVVTTPGKVPRDREMELAAGGHLKGCRIGFDLGASDYKVSAVIDGEAVFTEEAPWTPVKATHPEYHYHHISAALHRAAAHLPRVDAIGGSSAGIIVDNEIRVASLLRSIPRKDFVKAAGVFKRIQREWNVPMVVMNDGDVTALAGALSLGQKGMLGIAMGSSEAAGFMDPQGRILGWLNELAFAPVDYNLQAAADEWSGDRGVGSLYFSQQAVNKLLPAAKIKLPDRLGLPERLQEVQALMAKGDERAAKIYETIGVYLGYTIPHYAEFYDFNHLLILGRVTTGKGGDIVIAKAREVLKAEFPEVARKVAIHVPDEKSRRVGQAVAAASLPALKK